MDWKKIIFVCSLVLFVSSADRSLIMIERAKDIWISMHNFTALIEVSLNFSVCANVHVSGSSPGIEVLFHFFTRAYAYDYMINERQYECTGNLMLFSTPETFVDAMKRVPTTNSNTEILIVVDGEIEDSAELFNVTIYENVNVNIAAINGLWTLSENFLYPRKFREASEYEEMRHERGIVDFQGREIQVVADLNPPLSYLKTTVNRTVDGIERQYFVAKKGDPELDGIEVKLFLLMAERLNFTFAIRSYDGANRYGTENKTHWCGGIMEHLMRKEVDVAFSGIWLELPRFAAVNLSIPWTELDVRFLVPRPKPHACFLALARPLSPAVWLAVFTVLILQSIYVYARAWLDPREPERYRNFVSAYFEMMKGLLGLTVNEKWRGFELQLWHMMGVLVVTAYSSSLAASLASSRYEQRIDTTKQFIEANLTWGREGTQPSYSSFNNVLDPWASKFLSRFELEYDEEERHRKIKQGNYAILGRVIDSVFFSENPVRDEDLQNYRVMEDDVGRYYVSFAVQSWLLNSCNKIMLWLGEAGLKDYHVRDTIRRRSTEAHRNVLVEYDVSASAPRVLELTSLSAAFATLVIGLSLSTIVFYFELSVEKQSFVGGEKSSTFSTPCTFLSDKLTQ